MPKRVYLATRNLLFRSKLAGAVTEAGGEVTHDAAACDLAVVEIEAAGPMPEIRAAVERGVPVLAFGSHVAAAALRAAREAGAVAVPNSQVEERLRAMLTSPRAE